MNPGEKFEIRCYEYLKKMYETDKVTFDRKGGMDSTESDIAVVKNNEIDFYIEAKDSKAQAGQFVLIPDEESKKFIFSPNNKSTPNEMTDIIIEHMNKDFDRYNNAGTAGESINLKQDVFAGWVIGHYEGNNVKYFISYDSDYVILPTRKFTSYFDIIAKYRAKKSGSTDPSKKDYMIIKEKILEIYPNATFIEEDNKLFAEITDELTVEKFQLDKYTYYLSPIDNAELYRIRRLSNTKNLNVIFSIELVKKQDKDDLDEFKSDL